MPTATYQAALAQMPLDMAVRKAVEEYLFKAEASVS